MQYNRDMPYLVDGHNVIPRIPGLSLAEVDDEAALIALLEDFCRRERTRVEVYFDNAPPGEARRRTFGAVRAHFIRRGRTADAAIRRRLAQLGGKARNWTVVSSDREVQAAARDQRARVLSAAGFAERLAAPGDPEEPPGEKAPPMSPEELDAWLRLFGDGEDK